LSQKLSPNVVTRDLTYLSLWCWFELNMLHCPMCVDWHLALSWLNRNVSKSVCLLQAIYIVYLDSTTFECHSVMPILCVLVVFAKFLLLKWCSVCLDVFLKMSVLVNMDIFFFFYWTFYLIDDPRVLSSTTAGHYLFFFFFFLYMQSCWSVPLDFLLLSMFA
jgi:hypothetical protein